MPVTTRKPSGIIPILYAATRIFCIAALSSASAQMLAQPAPPKTLPTNLLNAYRYAFQAYAHDDAEAAAQEYNGEPGAAKRDTLRQQLNLTPNQFVLVQNAALKYRSFMKLIEGRLEAVVRGDRVLHPVTKGASPEAKAKVHSLLVELAQKESESIHFIHQSMDTPTAQKLDDAVASFYAESPAHVFQPKQPQRSTARTPSGASPARPAVLLPDPCSDPTIICSTCSPDLDPDCGVDDGGDGGGGGGANPPNIANIDPPSITLGESSVQVTISGSGFGSSPTVYLPAGVTSTGQVSTDSTIVVVLSVGYNATVGNNNVSVTNPAAGSSNAANLVLDGPYHLIVESDVTETCLNCTTTVQRRVTYQIKNFSGTNAGTTNICEQPAITGYSCTINNGTSADWCPGTGSQTQSPTTSESNGQFTDEWSMASDGYTPVGCGFNITDPWSWLTPSSTIKELGKASGYVHTNAVEIDNVTSTLANKATIPTGTVMPK
jgi:hypothetical protein